MREAEIEEVLFRRFTQATGLPFDIVDRQVQLSGRASRLDLLSRDPKGVFWALELKARAIVPRDIDQVRHYVR
jgi:RecB family endonuclease NucS